jgi:thiamine biosynthesis lipoprotein
MSVAGATIDRFVRERHWRAMGGFAHVVLVGAAGSRDDRVLLDTLLDDAAAEIERLEARWSRFRPDSDVAHINARAGRPVIVAPDTLDLIERALDHRRRTGGRFDPTVLPALVAAGYDRSYDEVEARVTRDAPAIDPGWRAGSGVFVDAVVGAVAVAAGAAIDLGGIGKGRAADLVATKSVERGAAGALVNLGGDLRAIGAAPTAAGWVVAIDPVLGVDKGRIAIANGAVATSSQLTRRWCDPTGAHHHLIDPATGEPSRSSVAAATVVAATAERAEVLAKTALIAGGPAGTALLERLGVAAIIVGLDGRISRTGGFERYAIADRAGAGPDPVDAR